jgi:flagellar hook assembly protein FlgD
MAIYNIIGQRIKTISGDKLFQRGAHSIVWEGRDETGKPASSGIYFVIMRTGEYQMTKKMMMLK